MKTAMSIKVDREVKIQAQALAQELGFPLSTLINAFLKQFIRDKGFYFSLLKRRYKPFDKPRRLI